MSVMTKHENIITEIKNFITAQVNEMTYSEYEDLCRGDGLLGIVDKAISNTISVYRVLIPDTEEIINGFNDETWNNIHSHLDEQLSIFIDKTYVNVLGYRLMIKQVLTDITDMSSLIHDVLIDMDNIGRLKAYVDLYTECADKLIDDHYVERQNIKATLLQLVQTLQDARELTDDDMSDLFNDYLHEFDEKCQRALDNYRKHYDYNNTDHFIEMLNEITFADFNNLESQLIATIYYSTVTKDEAIKEN